MQKSGAKIQYFLISAKCFLHFFCFCRLLFVYDNGEGVTASFREDIFVVQVERLPWVDVHDDSLHLLGNVVRAVLECFDGAVRDGSCGVELDILDVE